MPRFTDSPAFWLLFAAVVYTPFIDLDVGMGNVAGDLAAIESLVERRTFFIDDSTFETIDRFRRPDTHRLFSQKSPIFHLIAAAPYAALHALGLRLSTDLPLCLRALTFVMVVLPMGWLLWAIHSHPWMRARPPRFRFRLTLAFALGSLLTPFAVTLNHYTLAAACLMMAVRAIARGGTRTDTDKHGGARTGERQNGWALLRSTAGIGFWISASLAADVPPAFLFGAATAVFLLRRPRELLALAAGAAPLLLLYAALNFAIVGSPLPPNFHEEEMLFYEGSFWAGVKARADAGDPGFYQASYARRLFHSALGHKGIYWMMPLVAIATLAAVSLARRRADGWRLALALAAFPLATIAVVMIWAFDLSGGAYAIRHAFAAIPPLFCVLAHPELNFASRSRRLALVACSAWGALVAWIGVLNPWSHNTLSAIPPLENVARFCLKRADRLPTEWIGALIRRSSVEPEIGWLDYALELKSAGRLERSESALRESIRLDPRAELPRYHLGVLLGESGRFEESIVVFRELIELNPEHRAGLNGLGVSALNAARLDEAEAAFKRSLQVQPDGNPTADLGLRRIESIRRPTPPPA